MSVMRLELHGINDIRGFYLAGEGWHLSKRWQINICALLLLKLCKLLKQCNLVVLLPDFRVQSLFSRV